MPEKPADAVSDLEARPSADFKDHVRGRQFSLTGENEPIVAEDTRKLKRNLHGRHMQMIAIGRPVDRRETSDALQLIEQRRCDRCRPFCWLWGGFAKWRTRKLGKVPVSCPTRQLLMLEQVICFIIVGVMILMVMQALGELAVMYPVNGAFYTYIVRFIDPSW